MGGKGEGVSSFKDRGNHKHTEEASHRDTFDSRRVQWCLGLREGRQRLMINPDVGFNPTNSAVARCGNQAN